MDITPILAVNAKSITGYGPGFFRLGEDVIQGPILLYPDHVKEAPVKEMADLTPLDITSICHAEPVPDILLFGMGPTFDQLPARPLQLAARAAGVSMDVMDTGAACRTWNVLLSEGRRVAALLWPV